MTRVSPPKLVHIVIVPRCGGDRSALEQAATALVEAGFDAAIDEDTDRMVLAGESEEQLEAALARLRGRHQLDLTVGAPQIAYRETLARRIETDFTHKKPIAGGRFELARLKLVFKPGVASSFISRLPDGGIPRDLLAGAERGIERARRAGVLAGSPVVDVEVALVDGAYHEADSTPAAFETAAIAAFHDAQRHVGVLLEPIMHVEVFSPECHIEVIRNDLHARRGEVGRASLCGDGVFGLASKVPLANLLGYPAYLHRLTQGEARIAMTFSHFAPVDPPEPPDVPAASAQRIA